MYNFGLSLAHTGDCDPRGVAIELGCMAHEEVKCSEAVVELRRIAVLRNKAILHRNNNRVELECKQLTRTIVLLCVQTHFLFE
jgi:hypothetical protein